MLREGIEQAQNKVITGRGTDQKAGGEFTILDNDRRKLNERGESA